MRSFLNDPYDLDHQLTRDIKIPHDPRYAVLFHVDEFDDDLKTQFTTKQDAAHALAYRSLLNQPGMALKYAPFVSEIEINFYTNLSQLKIDHDKLDDSARRVLGLYEPQPTATPDNSCRMRILGNALTSDEYVESIVSKVAVY